MDPYSILQCSPSDSIDTIKKAYRKLQLKYHPDKTRENGSTQQSQQIRQAYEFLCDDEKRKEYDANCSTIVTINQPSSLSSTTISEHYRPPHKPPPIVKHITILMSQTMQELSVPIAITRTIKYTSSLFMEQGTKENGEGNRGYTTFDRSSHYETEKETIYVTLPQGIDNNEMILIENKGDEIDTIKGDVKIFINIDNNTPFIRDGLDLLYTKTITLCDALCGFSFCINHPNGNTYTISHSTNRIVHPNYTKTYPQLGMTRNGVCGRLIISFCIQFPEQLSSTVQEQIRHLLNGGRGPP